MSANVNKYYRRVITNCPTSRQPSYWQQIYGTRHTYISCGQCAPEYADTNAEVHEHTSKTCFCSEAHYI